LPVRLFIYKRLKGIVRFQNNFWCFSLP